MVFVAGAPGSSSSNRFDRQTLSLVYREATVDSFAWIGTHKRYLPCRVYFGVSFEVAGLSTCMPMLEVHDLFVDEGAQEDGLTNSNLPPWLFSPCYPGHNMAFPPCYPAASNRCIQHQSHLSVSRRRKWPKQSWSFSSPSRLPRTLWTEAWLFMVLGLGFRVQGFGLWV